MRCRLFKAALHTSLCGVTLTRLQLADKASLYSAKWYEAYGVFLLAVLYPRRRIFMNSKVIRRTLCAFLAAASTLSVGNLSSTDKKLSLLLTTLSKLSLKTVKLMAVKSTAKPGRAILLRTVQAKTMTSLMLQTAAFLTSTRKVLP